MVTDTLKDIVHGQSNELWDVSALLNAAVDRAVSSPHDDNELVRLLHMASEKLTVIQSVLTEHI